MRWGVGWGGGCLGKNVGGGVSHWCVWVHDRQKWNRNVFNITLLIFTADWHFMAVQYPLVPPVPDVFLFCFF